MDQPVTRPAQEHQVLERGEPAVFPRDEVVRLTPAGGSAAAGAAPIAADHRAAQAVRDHPGQPAHIQRLAAPVEHDRHDRGIAAQHPQRGRGQGATEVQTRRPGPVLQILQRDVHVQLRPRPTTLRQITVVQDIATHIGERFGLPLRRSPLSSASTGRDCASTAAAIASNMAASS